MAKADEMLMCERCGVTFLWPLEEQWASQGQPTGEGSPPRYCLGCRHLLPAADRQRGLVKWYSPRKKYGFISPQSGPDLFAHRSGLRKGTRLRPGDLVEFAVEKTEKGPVAVDVALLQREEKSETAG